MWSMPFKINLDPFSADHYFTVREHILVYKSHGGLQIKLESIALKLRNLLGIPQRLGLNILPISAKEELANSLENFYILDSPNDVLRKNSGSIKNGSVDISFSFPQCTSMDMASANLVAIDSNLSFGIPNNFYFVLSERNLSEFNPYSAEKLEQAHQEELYLISNVLDDYKEKQLEVLLRESNYKSAVINQLFESHRRLEPVGEKIDRSKSVLLAKCDRAFCQQIEGLGYVIHARDWNEGSMIAIANYPTHSKEMIEMFADRVSEI